jgi:hypothetical protein
MCADRTRTVKALLAIVAVLLGIIAALITGIVLWALSRDMVGALSGGGVAFVMVTGLILAIMTAIGCFASGDDTPPSGSAGAPPGTGSA